MRAGIFAVFLQNGKGPLLGVAGRPFEIFSAVSIIAGWGNSDAFGARIFGLWNERVAGIFEVGGVDRLSGWQSVSPPTQAELGRGTPGCGESALLRVRVGHPPTCPGSENASGGSLLAPVRSLLRQKLCEQFAGVCQLPYVRLVTDFDHGIGQQMLAFR